jgi:hypothetical protein
MDRPTAPEGAAHPTAGPARAADREAVQFLHKHVAPALRRDHHTALAKAVGSAVADGSLGALASLPERQRRDLLEAIESKIDTGTSSLSPRALVRLTSAIAALPPAERYLGRRLAAPAR